MKRWNTDTAEMAAAVAEFERRLPGFWWSVGQCSVGAHASCAVDGSGVQGHLLDGIESGDPFDTGFHADTDGGSPDEALRNVMNQALADPRLAGQNRARQEEGAARLVVGMVIGLCMLAYFVLFY